MALTLIQKISDSVAPKHYFALLGSLLGLTLLAPLVDHFIWARIAIGGMMLATLLTASLAIKGPSRITIFVLLLAIVTAVMWTLALSAGHAGGQLHYFDTVAFQIATNAVTLFFFLIACFIILQDVFSGAITSDKIGGAVCVYLLVGFSFSMIHLMIALADPNAYHNTLGSHAKVEDSTWDWPGSESKRSTRDNSWLSKYPLFVYFSFCTFSTVGYGDMIPISRLARSVSCLEATFGQLYLAVLVARLVGLHTATISLRQRKELSSAIEERDLLVSKKN